LVEAERSGDSNQLVIRVADTGPGVILAMRDRLFEPFATTKDSGMGLGLRLGLQNILLTRDCSAERNEFELSVPLARMPVLDSRRTASPSRLSFTRLVPSKIASKFRRFRGNSGVKINRLDAQRFESVRSTAPRTPDAWVTSAPSASARTTADSTLRAREVVVSEGSRAGHCQQSP
jgi:hypothetical protein